MMAEYVETRCEEDPTRVMDLKNGDQEVPSSDFSDLHDPDDVNDGEVQSNCPIKPKSDDCVQILNAAKPVLQKKVLVGNILPKLHKSAGGFLDDVERDKVKSGGSNQTKMHILLEIMKTKDDTALTTFCKVLEDSKYVEAAEKLKKEIASRGHFLTSSLGDCPSEIELDEVSKIVGGNWESMLVHLGVPVAKIEALLQDYPRKTQSACFHGLVFWQRGNKPCRPATWSMLLNALEKGAELKEYADRRRSELLSLSKACQTAESLEKTHKALREKNVALSLSPLEAEVKKLNCLLAKVFSHFRHHVTQLSPKSLMYDEVRSICQTTIASKAGISSFNTFDIPLDVSEFAEYIIKEHTTFFDIEHIHNVANVLQQPTLTETVVRYEADLKPLMMTKITELNDRCEVMPINQDSPEGTSRLVLKFPSDTNIKNLYKAKDYLEKVLKIPKAKLLAFDFGCILAYFEITCTADILKDLPKRFLKQSDELKAMGISRAFFDHWAWSADSDGVWYTDDESDDMEVNDQQGFLGNRKRSHLGSVSGRSADIVPSKKASHLKESCPVKKESGDRQGTAEEDCCSQPHHSPIPCAEEDTDNCIERTENVVESDEEKSWHTDTDPVVHNLPSPRDPLIEEVQIDTVPCCPSSEVSQTGEAPSSSLSRKPVKYVMNNQSFFCRKLPSGEVCILTEEEIDRVQKTDQCGHIDRLSLDESAEYLEVTPEEVLKENVMARDKIKELEQKLTESTIRSALGDDLKGINIVPSQLNRSGFTSSGYSEDMSFSPLFTIKEGQMSENLLGEDLRRTVESLRTKVKEKEESIEILKSIWGSCCSNEQELKSTLNKACETVQSLDKPTIAGHPWYMLAEEKLQHKTPSDSGLYEVASQVHSAEDQHILAKKLGVTLRREQRNPLFNALKRWRDGGGGEDHPPTWRCLLDALSRTSGVDPHVVRDWEEKAKYLTEFSLSGVCREIFSLDYHYQTSLRSTKLLRSSSSGKSITKPVLRQLAKKRRNRLKAISLSTHSQRTILTSHTSQTSSLPFLALPQISFVHFDSTDEVGSTRKDQTVLAATPRMSMPVAHNPGGDSLGYPPSESSKKHSPVFMSSLQQQQGPPSQYYDGGGFDSEAFMDKFSERFLKYVDSNAIVFRLEIMQVISRKVAHTISHCDVGRGNEVLFDHLKNHADPDSIRRLCDVMIRLAGYPRMNELGRAMQEELAFLTSGVCREISSSHDQYQTILKSTNLLKLSSSSKSSTQPVHRQLARKRRNRFKAISSSAHSLIFHHQKSQRTILTSHTSHTPSLPFLAQPQTSSVQSDLTDEVESTEMDQTDSGFSNHQ